MNEATPCKRYQVVRAARGEETVVFETNKRKTAHRRAAFENASNLSHVSSYMVKAGERYIEPSVALEKREGAKAAWDAHRNTVGYRGVW